MIFSEEEILNTFLPVLECLNFIHRKGIVHGSVHPANVVVTEDEEVKLKDWLVEIKDNPYYCGKRGREISKDDDVIAFGQILTQAATLRKGKKLFLER
ncbi:unnamed protein product [Sphagnum balticum]